jgi:hypothetical protein
MIEYTLDQMIEKFRRNHSLKFEYLGGEGHGIGDGTVIHLTEDGYIVGNFGHSILSCFNLGSRFRLINEPVDRMTAFRAFEQGKTICCELNGTKCTFIPIKTTFTGFSIEQILYGKWFIEEEN